MQLGSVGAVIPIPTAGPGQGHAGEKENSDFYYSKDYRLICYLFIFT